MNTRRNFLKIFGSATLVGGGAFGIFQLESDDPKELDVYSRLEQALLEENPDVAPETLKVIATDFVQISDKLKAGTAGVSGLTGAFFDKLAQDRGEDVVGGHNITAAFSSYVVTAGQSFKRYSNMREQDDLSQHLQDAYSLTSVQSIHVAKTLRNIVKNDFQSRYGVFASAAGSVSHRLIGYVDGRINLPSEPNHG